MLINQLDLFISDSQQPFALVFDFSALLGGTTLIEIALFIFVFVHDIIYCSGTISIITNIKCRPYINYKPLRLSINKPPM
jgi:hypothetical protein